MDGDISAIIGLVRSHRFDLSTEKHLQVEMDQVFTEAGLHYVREKPLSARDIPDFMIDGGIVVECKIRNKAKKMDVYRQLCRYAEHPEVSALILVSNLSMGMPEEINGKPVYMASLSAGWM